METYSGPTKLVIAIDVGATNSAIAYQYLLPDAPIPRPTNVGNWPGAQSPVYVKVPSFIFYRDRIPVSYGLQAVEDAESMDDIVKTEGGHVLIKNFKLAMHPRWMQQQAISFDNQDLPDDIDLFEKPDLPRWLTIQKVYQDYIKFLLDRTKQEFIESSVGGQAIWQELITTAQYIIGAPNGWGISEKAALKKAVAGAAQHGRIDRVTVVTEGEASLHYLINSASRSVPLRVSSMRHRVREQG